MLSPSRTRLRKIRTPRSPFQINTHLIFNPRRTTAGTSAKMDRIVLKGTSTRKQNRCNKARQTLKMQSQTLDVLENSPFTKQNQKTFQKSLDTILQSA